MRQTGQKDFMIFKRPLMSTPPGESPAVARRRVRRALRQAREAKGLTQQQVADEMEWSLSKVTRIESGEVSISATDLRALLPFLDITDRVVVTQLMDEARVSRRQRWFMADRRYRDHLSGPTLQLIQFEAEATAIRSYNAMLIPGLLQTPAYTQAVLASYSGWLSEVDTQLRLDVRNQRREQWLSRPDAPELLVLLDESVLYREVGGPTVMGEQLQSLLNLTHEYNLLVRIAPFTKAAPIALLGPFMLIELGDPEDTVLYREDRNRDEIIQTRDEIDWHRTVFEELWRLALNDADSAQLIKERSEMMLSADSGAKPPG
jgi:transcriptional regulator with XRE-family HTH domain